MLWRCDISASTDALAKAREALFSGRFRTAHEAAQTALRADGGALDAVLVMAAIAVEHDNAAGASRLCELARKAGRDDCWLIVLEGRVALLRQDLEGARAAAAAAASRSNEDPHIANQLGVLLSRTGQHAQAVDPFSMAADGVPDNSDYRYNLAVALQFAGRLAEAEHSFRMLVAQCPGHARGWLALVQLARDPEPAWAQSLEAAFESADDAEGRLTIGHALARLAERAGDWDRSLEWLDRAKLRMAAEKPYDQSEGDALFAAAARSADGHFAPQVSGDERPLFILGMPRSGTTLVDRIVGSHPAAHSLGELTDFGLVLKQALGTPGPLVLDAQLIAVAADRADLREIGERYLQRLDAIAPASARLIDKMPFNAFFAPAILRALPGARIVCLRRSPHDLVFANYRQLFATGFGYYGYSHDFVATARFVARFHELIDRFAALLPPDRFLPVQYEDVVRDQRRQTERILNFCGLEWDEACMHFHRNAQPVATASSIQVRSPIYSSSIDSWRRYGEGARRVERELARYGLAGES